MNFHIGESQTSFNMFGRAAWQSTDLAEKLALGSAALFFENARVLGNLLDSEVLELFSKVKSSRSRAASDGFPSCSSRSTMRSMRQDNANGKLKMLPFAHFLRQVYGCFRFEKTAPSKLLEDIGVENVLFETDFSHPTCLYPDHREHVEKVMEYLSPHVRRSVLQDNAAKLYRIFTSG